MQVHTGTSLTKEIIDQAKNDGKAIVFKQAFPDTPSWVDIINLINNKINQDDLNVRPDVHFTKGHLHFWDRLTIGIDKVEQYFDMKNIIEKLNSIHKSNTHDCMGMVSFTAYEKTTGKHTDPVDNFYWQLQGEAKWSVNNTEYVLEAGDLIFNPAENIHEITSLSPRAAIAISYVP